MVRIFRTPERKSVPLHRASRHAWIDITCTIFGRMVPRRSQRGKTPGSYGISRSPNYIPKLTSRSSIVFFDLHSFVRRASHHIYCRGPCWGRRDFSRRRYTDSEHVLAVSISICGHGVQRSIVHNGITCGLSRQRISSIPMDEAFFSSACGRDTEGSAAKRSATMCLHNPKLPSRC
jgi:hypothetical protein